MVAGGQERHLCHFPDCGKTFTKTAHLQVCTQYGVMFIDKVKCSPKLVQIHLRTHAGIRPFICSAPHCGASFARRNDLLRHIGSLHSAANFPCVHCGKSFGRKDHMKQHAASCGQALIELTLSS